MRTFPRQLYWWLLVALCALYATRSIRTPYDFWAHAAVGRWIVQHGQAPHETLFIWSIDKQHCIDPSWLAAVIYYGCLQLGPDTGAAAALLLTALLCVLSYYCLWRLAPADAPLLLPLFFALAIECAHGRFSPRPESFTALCFAFLLMLLVRWSNPAAPLRTRALLGLLPIFALWSNLHGGFLLGLITLVTTAICELLQQRFALRARRLLWLAPACALMALINPYGREVYTAVGSIKSPNTSELVLEWMPLWHMPFENGWMIAGLCLLVALAFLAWLANPQRRWAQLVWLLLLTVAWADARRQQWLLSQVCLAVLAANSAHLQAAWQRCCAPRYTAKPLLSRMAPVAVFLCLLYTVWRAIPTGPEAWRARSPYLPDAMVRFIDDRPIRGRIFTLMDGSGYFNWSWGERRPLFITIFVEQYPPELLYVYSDMLHRPEQMLEGLRALNVAAVVIPRHNPDHLTLNVVSALDHSPDWRRDYSADDGAVWVRRQ